MHSICTLELYIVYLLTVLFVFSFLFCFNPSGKTREQPSSYPFWHAQIWPIKLIQIQILIRLVGWLVAVGGAPGCRATGSNRDAPDTSMKLCCASRRTQTLADAVWGWSMTVCSIPRQPGRHSGGCRSSAPLSYFGGGRYFQAAAISTN